MTETLSTTLAGARADLDERIAYDPDVLDDEPHDLVFEIADSNTPIYYSDLMDVASSDYDMILTEPSIGPAFDGEPTPINIIAANIYEAICADLFQYWEQLQDERED